MGPESIPVPAEVYFRDGLLVVNRKDDQPVGVALLWQVSGDDTLHVETLDNGTIDCDWAYIAALRAE